jgi:co-chaperonin GroES (HSP10)
MIEQISLEDFELTSNFILIKGGLDYNYIEIPGPLGTKVQLELCEIVRNEPEKKCITGTVLRVPKELSFHGELNHHERGKTIADDEFCSLMRTSMPHKTVLNVKEGDNVIFDYKMALDAESEGRLLNVEGHGYCLLMGYESLYAKESDGDLVPLNGWVFALRDQNPNTWTTENGLIVVEKVDKYGSKYATILKADHPIEYLDKNLSEPPIPLNHGDRVILQRGFGYRIASDRYAGKLLGVEAVRRRNILATFENGTEQS